MTRPRCCFNIRFCPSVHCFNPEGVDEAELESIELNPEEVEALRLKNIEGLEQVEAAKKMKVSQSTFQRVLSSAYKKVSQALVEGKAIKIISNK